MSANTTLMDHLIGAIELGYSRTPILAQRYYACLFDDLLSFQMEGVRPIRPICPAQPETPAALAPLRSSAAASFAHPSLQAERLPAIQNVIRWDYGENELPVPEFLQTAVLMAFAKRDRHAHECDPRQAIADLLFVLSVSHESFEQGLTAFKAFYRTVSEKTYPLATSPHSEQY